MTITVYSKPSCVQCTATKKALDKAGVGYDEVDISVDDAARDYIMGLGFKQAPVVIPPAGESEAWSGFRPDKTKAAIAAQEQEAESTMATDSPSADLSSPDPPGLTDQLLEAGQQQGTGHYVDVDTQFFYDVDLEGSTAFAGEQLDNIRFVGGSMQMADFTDTSFRRSQFSDVDVGGAIFQDADMWGADLSRARNVQDADFTLANLERANLTGVGFKEAGLGGSNFKGAVAGLATFDHVLLHGANFEGADLTRSQFFVDESEGANFEGVHAPGVSFRDHSELREASFKDAIISGGSFTKCTLSGTDFTGASVASTDFTGSSMHTVDLGGVNGQGAQFTGCMLEEATMRDASFQGASFQGSDLYEVQARGTDFRGADFREVTAYGMDFTNTDCRGVNFSGADLSNADFRAALIDGANFEGATLEGVEGLSPSTEFHSSAGTGSDAAPVMRGMYAHTMGDQLAATKDAATPPNPDPNQTGSGGPETTTGPAPSEGPGV